MVIETSIGVLGKVVAQDLDGTLKPIDLALG